MKRFIALIAIFFSLAAVFHFSSFASATTTLVLFPSDDSHTSSIDDTTNYGSVPELSVVKTSAFEYITFLKFNTSDLDPESIVAATLKLNVTNGSKDTQQISEVPNNSWSETTISYTSQPDIGSTITNMTGYPDDSWVEFDVTSQVKNSPGSVSYAVTNSGADDIIFTSKESPQNNPQLIIITSQTDAIPNTDINSDGVTNYQDYNDLVNVFGNHGCDVNADVNKNCQIDIFDFASVVSQIN